MIAGRSGNMSSRNPSSPRTSMMGMATTRSSMSAHDENVLRRFDKEVPDEAARIYGHSDMAEVRQR